MYCRVLIWFMQPSPSNTGESARLNMRVLNGFGVEGVGFRYG